MARRAVSEARGIDIAGGNAGPGALTALSVLRAAVDAGTTPGGVLAAGWGDETEMLSAYGWAEAGPPGEGRRMLTSTAFDLASLTKVVVTLPVVLRLLADGHIALGSRVAELLPGFGTEPAERAEVTVEHLLTHTSGLPPHREHWRLGLSPVELRQRFLEEPLELAPGARPGSAVVYSDIGFILLGWLAEAVTGQRLTSLVSEWVVGPLGLTRTGYGPRPAEEVAATEMGREGSYIAGVMHDENAAALVAPVGHAGLFSTAGDIAAYAAAWLSKSEGWLPRSWRDEAVRDRTAGLGGHRGLGWVARGDAFDPLGETWPATAVSHTGFTGTSLAFDPPSGRWVALLTNDVHFGRGRGTVKELRRAVQEALAP